MYKPTVKRGSTQWYVEMNRKIQGNMISVKSDAITITHTRIMMLKRMFRIRSIIDSLPTFEQGTFESGGIVSEGRSIILDNSEKVLTNDIVKKILPNKQDIKITGVDMGEGIGIGF